jgi:hypothetical protein
VPNRLADATSPYLLGNVDESLDPTMALCLRTNSRGRVARLASGADVEAGVSTVPNL